MYLYIFETGDVLQHEDPPSLEDLKAIFLNNLRVFWYKDGDYFECDANGREWSQVSKAILFKSCDGATSESHM